MGRILSMLVKYNDTCYKILYRYLRALEAAIKV